MTFYKRRRAARRIQRGYRRFRKYRRKPWARQKRPSTGSLVCYQKYSKLEPIPSVAVGTAGAFTGGQLTFSLSDLVGNVGNYTRLFKYWKIMGVKVTFTPRYLGDFTGPTGDPNPALLISGNMMTAITLDSNQLAPTTANWTTIEQAEESSNLKKRFLSVQTGGRTTHVVKFKPRLNNWIRVNPSSNNNAVALANPRSWVSTGTPGVTYQGLKWGYETNQPHPQFDLEIRVSMLLAFKGVV